MKNKNNGISLIALVITIVVLIILTTTVIIVFKEGGIMDKAEEAVFRSDFATIKEMVQFANNDKMMETLGGQKINVLETDENFNDKIKQTLSNYDNNGVLEKEINGHKYYQLLQIYEGKLYQTDMLADSNNDEDKKISQDLTSIGIEPLFIEYSFSENDGKYPYFVRSNNSTNIDFNKDYNTEFAGTTLIIPNTYIDENGNKIRMISNNTSWSNVPKQRESFKNVKTINVSKGITSIGHYAFMYLYNLEKIKLPSTVTAIGICAFSGCENLKDITIPESVTWIGTECFRYCYLIGTDKAEGEESINLSQTKIRRIDDWAFSWCTGLKKIVLPETLTSVGNCVFIYCSGLEEVYIPGSLKELPVSMFNSCTSLKKVTISEGVKIIRGYVFQSTSEEFTNIEIPKSVEKIYASAFAGSNPNLIIKVNNTKAYCDSKFEVNWNKRIYNSDLLFTTEYTDQIVYTDGTVIIKSSEN